MKINKIKYRYHLLFAVLIIIFVYMVFPKIPYLNLFAYYSFDFILFITLSLLLKFKVRLLYVASLFLIVIMGMLTLAGRTDSAERLGTSTFLMLLLACMLSIRDLVKR